MTALTLALPSKGRLQEQTLAWFADCGLAIAQQGGERGYSARLPALPAVDVRLAAAAEIADGLMRGEIHLGVTGEDLLRELDPRGQAVVCALPLGFGRADLVVATPRAWIDVATLADFADICAERRARTGARLRVATKYVVQTQAFFARAGIDDYRLVASAGATEAAPAAGVAESIVDITTTGATLAANGLRPLVDGVILRSEAHLAASCAADWTQGALETLERVLFAAQGRAEARGFVLIEASIPTREAQRLAAALAPLGCTPVGGGSAGLRLRCPQEAAGEAAWRASLEGHTIVITDPLAISKRPVAAFDRIAPSLRRVP